MPAMSDEEREGFLAQPVIGRLGCLDDDGYPYVVPVWFDYADGGVIRRSGQKRDKRAVATHSGDCHSSICCQVAHAQSQPGQSQGIRRQSPVRVDE